MGAPNFALRNAKRYFIIEEPEDAEFWWVHDTNDYLAEKAVEHGFEWLENDEWRKEIERCSDICRDYCATALECLYETHFTDKFGGYWKASLVPLVRSGYYAHACLDFYIELRTEYGENLKNEDATNVEVLKDVIMDYFEYLKNYEGKEIAAGDGTELLKQIDEIIAKATDKFYEFAEDCGIDEYAKAWQASNGEAGYTNLSEIKRKAGKEVA